MNIWLLPDLHYGHTKLIDMNIRPEDYIDSVGRNIKSIVRSDDIILFLGDFHFCSVKLAVDWIKEQTDAKLWLIRGNHDSASVQKYMSRGFDFCADSVGLNYGGHKILFTHKPINSFNSEFDLNIHGHLHIQNGKSHHEEYDKLTDRHICLSLETYGYKVLNLKTVLKGKTQCIEENVQGVVM